MYQIFLLKAAIVFMFWVPRQHEEENLLESSALQFGAKSACTSLEPTLNINHEIRVKTS